MSATIHDAVSSTARSSWRAAGARHHLNQPTARPTVSRRRSASGPNPFGPPPARRRHPAPHRQFRRGAAPPRPGSGAIRRLTVNPGEAFGARRPRSRPDLPSGPPRRDRLRAGPGRTGVRRAVGPRPRRVPETSDPPGARVSDTDTPAGQRELPPGPAVEWPPFGHIPSREKGCTSIRPERLPCGFRVGDRGAHPPLPRRRRGPRETSDQ
jgi:hypothetical protein